MKTIYTLIFLCACGSSSQVRGTPNSANEAQENQELKTLEQQADTLGQQLSSEQQAERVKNIRQQTMEKALENIPSVVRINPYDKLLPVETNEVQSDTHNN